MVDLPPGRKLDVLVAVNVMGTEIIDDEISGVPEYSTSIAAAWLVIDHLQQTERGFCYFVFDNPPNDYVHASFDLILPDNEPLDDIQGRGQTAPHAIALASLEILERKKEETQKEVSRLEQRIALLKAGVK